MILPRDPNTRRARLRHERRAAELECRHGPEVRVDALERVGRILGVGIEELEQDFLRVFGTAPD